MSQQSAQPQQYSAQQPTQQAQPTRPSPAQSIATRLGSYGPQAFGGRYAGGVPNVNVPQRPSAGAGMMGGGQQGQTLQAPQQGMNIGTAGTPVRGQMPARQTAQPAPAPPTYTDQQIQDSVKGMFDPKYRAAHPTDPNMWQNITRQIQQSMPPPSIDQWQQQRAQANALRG